MNSVVLSFFSIFSTYLAWRLNFPYLLISSLVLVAMALAIAFQEDLDKKSKEEEEEE